MPLDSRSTESRSPFRSKSTNNGDDDEILSLLDTPAPKSAKKVTFRTDSDEVYDKPDTKDGKEKSDRRPGSNKQDMDYRLDDALDRALSGGRQEHHGKSAKEPLAFPTDTNTNNSLEERRNLLREAGSSSSIFEREDPSVSDGMTSSFIDRNASSYVPSSSGRAR